MQAQEQYQEGGHGQEKIMSRKEKEKMNEKMKENIKEILKKLEGLARYANYF